MVRIVITEPIIEPLAVEDLKRRGFDVHWDKELWTKRAELEKLVGDLPALIVGNRTRVDEALLSAAPKLLVVGRLGVGLDNIDVAACERRGIEVCTARGANATSVAEYAITMAMLLLRGRAYRDTQRLVAGEFPREELGRGAELAGKRLGIIGLGSIGGVTARKARALDMRVMAADPYLADSNESWNLAERATLETLLSSCEVVTIHCPLNAETRGMIGAAQMQRMKKGAILINAARGGIVDEAACAAALRSGHLGGAALDVFDEEPIKPSVGQLFAGLTNVILTPHISGVTPEARHRVSFMVVDGVARVLAKRA